MNKENKIYSGVQCILYTQTTDNYVLENKPIVTVSVGAYNSSQYILETLNSIKDQTYHNLILQICDDCSTDNTIEICKEWIRENQSRFVKTKIIVPIINTGVSANGNRNWDECETEWLKGIAGDDLLLPDCIEDNMAYVTEHPEAIIVFSCAKAFGVSPDRCRFHEQKVFDFSFFQMTPEQQYERIKYASCLPAATAFYNINRIREIGLRHDERIPFLEDRPKWITIIRKGIKFHFFDKETVLYRLHEKSLSNSSLQPPKFYESKRLAFFYYVFDYMYKSDPEAAIREAVRLDMIQYSHMVDCMKERDKYYKLSIYRILDIPRNIVRFIKRYI